MSGASNPHRFLERIQSVWEDPPSFPVDELSVQNYAMMIEGNMQFAQVNYGDGEWLAILGRPKGSFNSQGEDMGHPALRDALRQTLFFNTGVWCGTNPGRRRQREVNLWVEKHEPDVHWVFKDTLSGANVRGDIGPVFRAIRRRNTFIVGPQHLSRLSQDVVGHRMIMKVADTTAWMDAEATAKALVSICKGHELVLLCAGMGSNLIAHHAWPKLKLKGCSLLDMGAIFDPYVGVYSRKHYKRPVWQDAKRKNLED